MRRITVLGLLCFVLFSGCGRPATQNAAGGQGIEVEDFDGPNNGDNDLQPAVDEWAEFGEVVGDESHLNVKLSEPNPAANSPVVVEAAVGSAYGLVKAEVWVRFGSSPVAANIENPDEGGEWTKLEIFEAAKWDYDKAKMVPMDMNEKIADLAEYRLKGELAVPADPFTVEVKVKDPYDGRVMAFAGWKVSPK